MTTAEIYQRLRPLMFSIAYRMLGSVSEAEDIVQEAFLRYHTTQERAEIDSPKAYLSAVTTRLCIDHLRSARARREAYVGEWLPEPLLPGEAADVVVYGDSGGISPSWPRPIAGRDRVVRLMAGLSGQIRQLGITARRVEINGQPGALFLDPAGRLTNVFVVDIADGQIQTVRSVINPGKLHHLAP